MEACCPHCGKAVPWAGSLLEAIPEMLDRDERTYHTAASIAQRMGVPLDKALRAILQTLVLSRQITATKRGPAVIYDSEGATDILTFLDIAGPHSEEGIYNEMVDLSDLDTAHLPELLEHLAERGRIVPMLQGDQVLYRSVPVELYE